MDKDKNDTTQNFAIFTCAGGSNTGQLANAVGVKLVNSKLGYMVCLAGIAAGIENAFKKASKAQKVIAIDGCSKNCAQKILQTAGIKIDYHYDLTKLGIKKVKDSIEFLPEQIEIVEKIINKDLI